MPARSPSPVRKPGSPRTFTNSSGTATFLSNAKLYGITITAGTVDITATTMIDEVTPAGKTTAISALHTALAAHTLTSSGMPANFGLALLDNADLHKTTFGGQSVDANSLVISRELIGDANADGSVDLTDLSTILNNFGTSTFTWTSGNFDGAATIDLTDLSDVLNNFGLTNPNAKASNAPMIDHGLPAAPPEPATVLRLPAPPPHPSQPRADDPVGIKTGAAAGLPNFPTRVSFLDVTFFLTCLSADATGLRLRLPSPQAMSARGAARDGGRLPRRVWIRCGEIVEDVGKIGEVDRG